jgi:nitrous oxide reductase accessory protein NosL
MLHVVTVVLAKAEQTALEPTGRMVRFDGVNYRPEMRAAWEAKALVWLRRASPADVEKARDYAKKEGYRVFTFDPKEREPLEKAREAVLAAV